MMVEKYQTYSPCPHAESEKAEFKGDFTAATRIAASDLAPSVSKSF